MQRATGAKAKSQASAPSSLEAPSCWSLEQGSKGGGGAKTAWLIPAGHRKESERYSGCIGMGKSLNGCEHKSDVS